MSRRSSSADEYGRLSVSTASTSGEFANNGAVAGRSCVSCALCCKLLPIRELEKGENQWCVHCRPGRDGACSIYTKRPPTCRDFVCQWLVNGELGDEWQPTRAKMFVHYNADPLGKLGLYVIVDPSRPDAWRREPYHSQLKGWALANLRARKMRVYVNVGRHTFLVLPNAAVEVTDKFHIVVPVGEDRWEARCYDTREEAMRANPQLGTGRG